MARWLVIAAALALSACADRYIPVAATEKAPDLEAARATCREQAAAAGGNASLLGPVAGVVWGAAQGAATGALSGGPAEGAAIGAAAGLVVGAVAGIVADSAQATAAMDRCLVAHGYQRS